MAKKSNKTAHVLSLITKESPVEADSPEKEEGDDDVQTESEHNKNQENTNNNIDNGQAVVEMPSGDEISDIIKDKLLEELNLDDDIDVSDSAPKKSAEQEKLKMESSITSQNIESVLQDANITDEDIQNALFSPEQNGQNADNIDNYSIEAESFDSNSDITHQNETMTEQYTQSDEQQLNQDNTQNNDTTVQQENIQANNIAAQQENIQTNFTAEKQENTNNTGEQPKQQPVKFEKNYIGTNPFDEAQSKFVYINVMEEIVKDMALEFMEKFDVCTCDRCIIDTAALTLTNLPAKYIVSTKGSLFPLRNYYAKKFQTQVMSELTKACLIVKEKPNH